MTSPSHALLIAALLVQAGGASAACMVSAPALSFGLYDGLSGAPATTSGNAVVTCDQSPAPTVTVELSASAVSGGFFPRRLRQDGGSDLLAYNFYTGPGGSSVWGDGSGGTVTRSQRVQKNQPWSVTIYGVIAAGQDVAPGSYSDTITITINF